MFLVILVAAIALLMLMILKLKVHPVLGLFTAALITGVALGYGLVSPKIEGIGGTVDLISAGLIFPTSITRNPFHIMNFKDTNMDELYY